MDLNMKSTSPRRKNDIRSVWMLTREYQGVAGAGGVKDVSRDLAESLGKAGLEVRVIMPCYGFISPKEAGFARIAPRFEVDMDYQNEARREAVGFWHKKESGVEIVLVETPRFEEKLGVYTYTEREEHLDPSHKKGTGHYDYFAMNILLQKAALSLALWTGKRPDVFHCQDGHSAVLPAMMREMDGVRHYFRETGAVVTVHNAGIGYHQDVADLPFANAITGLPRRAIYSSLLNGSFDPFLAGANYASINTVSENYAAELQNTEMDALTGWLGHALKDRGVVLEGITNGINPDTFDPTAPERLGLPAAFDPLQGDLEGKGVCRRHLIDMLQPARLGSVQLHGHLDLTVDQPLIVVISRLTEQKGIDVLAQALEGLVADERAFQVVILGAGTQEIEAHLTVLAEHPAYSGRIAVLLGYDTDLANLLFAAGDFLVVPSRYEPCGLTDLMAQLMGNMPIVRRTGGLVKVRDGFNGFSYDEHSPVSLANAMRRALKTYTESPDVLKQMQVNAIRHIHANYAWDKVKDRYIALYKKASRI
jgi:starch synthase